MESKPVILAVDDQPQNLELIEAQLAPLGYEIVKAASGEDALVKLSDNKIDMVLLDVMMPGINGYEVCRVIKSRADYLPVIMITSLNDRDSRLKGIESGADDFISKPLDAFELKLRVVSLQKVKNLYDKIENGYRKIKELGELKDSLTSFIVHDLRNPLSKIKGFLDLLAQSELIAKRDLADVENASQAVKTMMGMIADLLDTAKMENSEIEADTEDWALEDIIAAAMRETDPMLAHNAVYMSVAGSEIKIKVRVQRDLVERVLQNLLSNAIRYSPDRGSVVVESAFDKNNKYALVSVSDNGSGIPQEHKTRIFDKYATVEAKNRRMRGSTGLGLAFCKLAVELHGGKIWVEDRVGGGSIFRFTLPLSGA